MLAILSDYLKEAATPEMCQALEEAHDVFDRIELEDYQKEFESILMMDGGHDRGQTLEAVVTLTRLILEDLIRKHEVVPAQDVSIERLTTFLSGILDIQDYEAHQDILNVVSMEGNPQEIFCELLSLVTPYSVEELIADLEDVNFVVITRIKEMAQTKAIPPASEEEQAQQRQYIERLQKFMRYADKQHLIVSQMLKSGLDVGFPFLTYVGLVGREIEEWAVEKIANELMAMALISSDGSDNPTSIIKEYLENYISDMNKLTKVHVKLSEIALGLQR